MVSTFYIPVENKIKYETNGQEYVQSQKINWISHDVSRGENLWVLAKKYKTKIDIIRQESARVRYIVNKSSVANSCWASIF